MRIFQKSLRKMITDEKLRGFEDFCTKVNIFKFPFFVDCLKCHCASSEPWVKPMQNWSDCATPLPTASKNNVSLQNLASCVSFTFILSLTVGLKLSIERSEMPEGLYSSPPPSLLQAS